MGDLRVLVADDHAILRDGLRSLVDRQPDMRIVADAADAHAAVEKCVEFAPDVAVLDLSMPGGGMHAVARVREQCPGTNVLVLTMHNDTAHLRAVRNAGAVGYVVKSAAATDLIEAIREVGAGRAYVRMDTMTDEKSEATRAQEAQVALQPREERLLRLIAGGCTAREIAEALGVEKATVATLRQALERKLGVRGRAALARAAVARGIVASGTADG